MLLAAAVLNPEPVTVTLAPTGADAGLNELIVGCAKAFNEMNKVSKQRPALFSNILLGDRDS